VEVHGRVHDAAELLGDLDEDRVGLQGVVAERQMPPVPLDQSERHINRRKIAESLLQLTRTQELHLDRG
jgi:hypothetical protein